ncbi:FIST N-terminal domain-containing protein [Sorangium sp. So ce315]|uniref:FIST signal transduction protein n=1 Tax=Sorangium sp. So ce315 TaxID=3133299 RepID=UPI003F602E3E
MTTQVFVGASSTADPEKAAAESVAAALRGAPRSERVASPPGPATPPGSARPAFALVLSTDQYDADALAAAVTRELPGVPWAGCCTAGVFAGSRLLRQGLVVGLVASDAVRVGVGVAHPVSKDGRRAGVLAASRALEGFSSSPAPGWSRALIVLPDALTGNAADVVRGAVEVGGTGVVWAGGGAGDNLRFVRTAQFAGGRAYSDSVVVVALDSPARMATGIRHGFRPYGPPTMVTRAEGTVVAELEYEGAFSVYQRTARARGDQVNLDGFATFAMTHPLGIPQADGEHVIRDPLRVVTPGGLYCVGEVPDGCLIRVMEGDPIGLVSAAREAAITARDAVGGPIAGAFVFDCISRCMMLGDTVRDELATFESELGQSVPVMGCLTFGEVGALGRGVPQFHNKTAVVLALGA